MSAADDASLTMPDPAHAEGAAESEAKVPRSLGPLRMIWRQALNYPRQVLFAFLALLTTSAATAFIPSRLKDIVDKGFGSGTQIQQIDNTFTLMLMVIVVLGLADLAGKPAAVVDIATLTGACVIALGHVVSGLFANDDPLLRLARGAGMSVVNRIGPARRFFMQEAGGATGDLPRLLRGEAL